MHRYFEKLLVAVVIVGTVVWFYSLLGIPDAQSVTTLPPVMDTLTVDGNIHGCGTTAGTNLVFYSHVIPSPGGNISNTHFQWDFDGDGVTDCSTDCATTVGATCATSTVMHAYAAGIYSAKVKACYCSTAVCTEREILVAVAPTGGSAAVIMNPLDPTHPEWIGVYVDKGQIFGMDPGTPGAPAGVTPQYLLAYGVDLSGYQGVSLQPGRKVRNGAGTGETVTVHAGPFDLNQNTVFYKELNGGWQDVSSLVTIDCSTTGIVHFSVTDNGELDGCSTTDMITDPLLIGISQPVATSPPNPPSDVSVEAVGGCEAGCVASVTLRWKFVSGADGYLIYNADTGQLAKWVKDGTATSYTFHNLPCGQIFHFYLKTHSYAGNSRPSKTVAVEVPACSGSGGSGNAAVSLVWPSDNSAINYDDFSAADYLVVFAWNKVDSAKGYLLSLELDDGSGSSITGQVVFSGDNGLIEAGNLVGIYFKLDKDGWNALVPYTVTWQVSALSDPNDLSSILGTSEKYSFTFNPAP